MKLNIPKEQLIRVQEIQRWRGAPMSLEQIEHSITKIVKAFIDAQENRADWTPDGAWNWIRRHPEYLVRGLLKRKAARN